MKALEICEIADQTAEILETVKGINDVVSIIKLMSITIKEQVADNKRDSIDTMNKSFYTSALEAKVEELELFKSEHLRLEGELNEILHPNGDGPTAPSFCDLVSYVRNDITKVPPKNLCADCSNSSFGNPYLESEQSWCHHCRDRYGLNSFFNPSTKL